MELKPGTKLYFINDSGELSFIKLLTNGDFLVEDEFGFEISVNPTDVMGAGGQLFTLSKGEEIRARSNAKTDFIPGVKKLNNSRWELDLHMEEICSAEEQRFIEHPLKFQIDTLRKVLSKCKSEKVKFLTIIHGKGKGVLRQEILNLLHSLEDVQYRDASFDKFGGGAIEAELFGLHR